MYLCRLGARRQVGLLLGNNTSRANFERVFGVEGFPHGDTLEKSFRRLKPEQLQEALSSLSETLIRKKVLMPYRVLERFYVVAVDGTGMLSFGERHCPNCLTRTKDGKTLYYHNVLEAKLVCGNGFCFSLLSEFIENSDPTATKQDCELKAFYRLAERLKERFPRLPILLTLDGLFAGGPTFTLCRKFGWHFMAVLKDGDLPSVNEEFASLSEFDRANRLLRRTGKRLEIKQRYKWVNQISYIDSQSHGHSLSVLECEETKPDKNQIDKTTKFRWVTSVEVKKNRVVQLADEAGRIRWKIENEGFNVQKNGGFALEHAFTTNPTSAKIFYFLLQIAHLISQLLEKGSILKKSFPNGFGSAKNLAFRLLEAWRCCVIAKDLLLFIRHSRFQIRFDSS